MTEIFGGKNSTRSGTNKKWLKYWIAVATYIELKNVGPFKFCWISIFCKNNYRIGYCGKQERNQIWQKVDFFLPKLAPYMVHTIHHLYNKEGVDCGSLYK